jgi:hypothetical protein
MPQSATPQISFHIEHVTARQHGGGDRPENLALACDRCNAYKGPNLTGIDPTSGEMVPLFHPRRDDWLSHFRVEKTIVVGVTATGRATVELLQMNADARVELRSLLVTVGEWPPVV